MRKNGFTLVELLIVIAVIAILAAVAFVALDPARRFAEARNAERWSEVTSIASAIEQYTVDNDGDYPDDLESLASATSITSSNTDMQDLCNDLVTEYLASLPADPSSGSYTSCTSFSTGYTISYSSGHFTISAPSAERSETISVTR